MFDNAKLRLTMPEAYEVHRRVIHWNAARLQRQAADLVHTDANFPIYMGRIGAGPAPVARSERLTVEQLLQR
jgi:hypothetical protein